MGQYSFESVYSDTSSSPSDDDNLFDIDQTQTQWDRFTEATDLDQDDLDLCEDSDLGGEDADLSGEDSDPGDEGSESGDEDSFDVKDFNVDDQVTLYNGNVHPPEYYRQAIQEPTQRDPYARYAKKTRPTLRDLEEQWKQCVTHRSSS